MGFSNSSIWAGRPYEMVDCSSGETSPVGTAIHLYGIAARAPGRRDRDFRWQKCQRSAEFSKRGGLVARAAMTTGKSGS
jgi:hypothetical protein